MRKKEVSERGRSRQRISKNSASCRGLEKEGPLEYHHHCRSDGFPNREPKEKIQRGRKSDLRKLERERGDQKEYRMEGQEKDNFQPQKKRVTVERSVLNDFDKGVWAPLYKKW